MIGGQNPANSKVRAVNAAGPKVVGQSLPPPAASAMGPAGGRKRSKKELNSADPGMGSSASESAAKRQRPPQASPAAPLQPAGPPVEAAIPTPKVATSAAAKDSVHRSGQPQEDVMPSAVAAATNAKVDQVNATSDAVVPVAVPSGKLASALPVQKSISDKRQRAGGRRSREAIVAVSGTSAVAKSTSASVLGVSGGGIPETALAVPAEPISGTRATRQEGCSGQCWFECGAVDGLYNIASAAYPKLSCGFCRASKQALDRQARETPALRTYLNNLIRNQQAEYKQRVRQGRLVPGGRYGSIDERAAAISDYAQELVISNQISDNSDVLWPNEAEYVSYKVMWHRMTEAAALAAFKALLNNPDIRKRGTADDPRVPLMGIPRTTATASKTSSRRLGSSSVINTADQMGVAAGRMNMSALPTATSGFFADVGGQVFSAGAASSVQPGSSSVLALNASGPAALPALEDLRAVSVAPQSAPLAATSGRSLRQHPSEPLPEANPREEKRTLLNLRCPMLLVIYNFLDNV